MLKALAFVVKLSLFSIGVLLAGEWIRWDGRSLSQHVQSELARIGRSDTVDYLKDAARDLTEDARSGFDKKARSQGRPQATAQSSAQASATVTDRTATHAAAPAAASRSAGGEKIPPSERQKLRALIRELNGSKD